MKICVYGAGAIGGHLAVRLARAGHEVSVVARGANLAAIRARGLTLQVGDEALHATVAAAQEPAALGPQDLVISTLKATGLGALAEGIAPLLGEDTAVLFAQNGIPWWYGIGAKVPAGQAPLPDLSCLDPGGALARAIEPRRVLGAVIMSSNEMVAPGVVHNDTPGRNSLTIGEPDDSASARIQALRQALREAQIDSPDTPSIRTALWRKLIVNLAGSSLCLLTEQPATIVARDAGIGTLFEALVAEGIATARAHGIALDPAAYASGKSAPPNHKPSILQDYEQGRPMEIDAILGAPQAFARAAGLATPTLDVVLALAACRARQKGLYAG